MLPAVKSLLSGAGDGYEPKKHKSGLNGWKSPVIQPLSVG